MEQEWILGK